MPTLSQCRSDALTDFMTVNAVSDDRPARGQCVPPFRNIIGEAPRRADDQKLVGVECFATAHIDQQRRFCRSKTRVEIFR